MDKVRKVIEENRNRKLTKHKKISNNTVIEIDHCSPLEILKLQKNLLYLKENEIKSFIKLQDHEKRKTRAYKEDENFRRFNYRSAEKVYKEFMLYAIGRNLMKYHRFLHHEIEKYEGKKGQKTA